METYKIPSVSRSLWVKQPGVPPRALLAGVETNCFTRKFSSSERTHVGQVTCGLSIHFAFVFPFFKSLQVDITGRIGDPEDGLEHVDKVDIIIRG